MRYYIERYNNYVEQKRLTNFDTFDLHNLKHSDSSLYRSLELILGSHIGGEEYIHKYNKYGITNVPVAENSFEFKGDNLKSLSIKDRRYSFLDVMDTLYDKTDSTYIYEVLASETKEFNRIRIPVYIDDGNTESVSKDDYIKAILNLDIEINYLQRKNIERPEHLNYDANVRFNTGDKDYDQFTRYIVENRDDKQFFREPYVFLGYNHGMKGINVGKEGALMPMSGANSIDGWRAGTYSVFTRHRNSRGNHSYKTKVNFFNTTDGTLKEVEKLLAIKKLVYVNEQLTAIKYEPGRINLVTSQDMVWGITKGMIGSNSCTTEQSGSINSLYAMTYLQNFPTVYVGFEEENKLDVSLNHIGQTIFDTTGLKRVGYITITFGNFKELGLHPTQYNKSDMYCRTSFDYSDNARFNIKISVPKGLPNLIYKGQMEIGSQIYLMPGYVEYDNNKFVTAELGVGTERQFHENDDIKYLNINSEYDHSRTFLMNQIDGTKVNNKNRVMELFKKVTRNMISPEVITEQWRRNRELYLDGEYVRNFGGWIFPPMRLGALSRLQEASYASNFQYDTNGQDPYKVGYGYPYTNTKFYGHIATYGGYSNLYNIIMGRPNHIFATNNAQFHYMCARKYLSLNPMYKRIAHDEPHPSNNFYANDGAL
nr:MAG TPA: hypothetical protein [Caudoviricetes sp.]